MPIELSEACYRVSVKALILDEKREKFMVTLEDTGWWELPGGGLDHGETVEEAIVRELREETGLAVTSISEFPLYCLVGQNQGGIPSVNMVYEVTLKDLNFTPTSECEELRFISPSEIDTINAFRNVRELAEQFDPTRRATQKSL